MKHFDTEEEEIDSLRSEIVNAWKDVAIPVDYLVGNIGSIEVDKCIGGNSFEFVYKKLVEDVSFRENGVLYEMTDDGIGYYIGGYALYVVSLLEQKYNGGGMQDSALAHFLEIVCSKRWKKRIGLIVGRSQLNCVCWVLRLITRNADELYVAAELDRISMVVERMGQR